MGSLSGATGTVMSLTQRQGAPRNADRAAMGCWPQQCGGAHDERLHRSAFCAVLTGEPPTSALMSCDTMTATGEARTIGAAPPLSSCRNRRPQITTESEPRGSTCLPSL